MKKEFFKSDRYFTMWDYQVSHGQLLIRSDMRKGGSKNIDVIFFDTTYIQLGTMLNGISIGKIGKNTSCINEHVIKHFNQDDTNLFEVISEGKKYYIIASFVRIFENELEAHETSLGFDNKGRAYEIAGSRNL